LNGANINIISNMAQELQRSQKSEIKRLFSLIKQAKELESIVLHLTLKKFLGLAKVIYPIAVTENANLPMDMFGSTNK